MSVTQPTSLTKPHRELHSIISDIGFGVEDEKQIGKYTLDCYVEEVHLGFEYDGPMHDSPKQKLHDKNRDLWFLEIAGVPILRINEVQLKDKEQLLLIIESFVEEHMWTISDRMDKFNGNK